MADESFYDAWFQPRGARAAAAPPGAPAPLPPQAAPAPPPESTGPPAPPPAMAPPRTPGPPTPPPVNGVTPPGAPPPRPPTPPLPGAADLSADFNLFMKRMYDMASGYGDPTARLSPFDSEHRSRALNASADKEQDALTKQWQKLADLQKDRAEAEMKALQPFFAKQDEQIKAETAEMRRAQGGIPDYRPPPPLNPNDVAAFTWGTMAVALIGGLAGKAGWMRVTQYFNGSVDGLIEGNRERAEDYYRAYKQEYDVAMGKWKATQEKWQAILYATDVPINRILKQAEIQAKIDGAEEKWLQAQQGHIDKLRSGAQAEERMMYGLDEKKAGIQAQIEIALSHISSGQRGMQFGAGLDSYGQWAAAKVAAGGNTQLLATLTTRWASPQRAAIWNMMAKEMYEQGIDPGITNQNQISLHVERAAQRWSKLQWEGMGRLEQSLMQLKPIIGQAIAQANGLRPQAANMPINAFLKEFGTGAATERVAAANTLAFTVSREYSRLATGALSNAQLHWGAQEKADQMVNGNMSLAALAGVYDSMTKEIKINRDALRDMTQMSMQDVISMGGQVHPQDYGLPPREQSSIDQAVQRYGPDASTSQPARP